MAIQSKHKKQQQQNNDPNTESTFQKNKGVYRIPLLLIKYKLAQAFQTWDLEFIKKCVKILVQGRQHGIFLDKYTKIEIYSPDGDTTVTTLHALLYAYYHDCHPEVGMKPVNTQTSFLSIVVTHEQGNTPNFR